MKPDSEDYYTIDEAALFKAGINPGSCCNRIEKAVERKVKGYKEAENFYYYLKDKIKRHDFDKASDTDIKIIIGGTLEDPIPDDFYVTGKDLSEWCEQEEQVKESAIDKPAARSVYLLLGLLISEFDYYLELNEKGIEKGETAMLNHVWAIAEKLKLSSTTPEKTKNLARSTLQRNIKAALNELIDALPTKD